MRIAYFTDTFSPQINGVANTMNYLTEYLNKRNIDYLLFAPEYDSNDLSVKQSLSVVRCKGIRPVFYPECSLAFPNYLLLKNRIASFNPDLIHITTEYGIGLCGLMAARDLKIPIVMSYHTNFDRYLNSYGLQHLSSAYWHYMKWFHHFAALNLCPSIDTKNNLNRKGFHDLGIWSRGVDLKDFGPQHYSQNMRDELGGKNAVIFQYAGRLSKKRDLTR
jgi:glycosyltransferase involved in cell wall biosynthesis